MRAPGYNDRHPVSITGWYDGARTPGVTHDLEYFSHPYADADSHTDADTHAHCVAYAEQYHEWAEQQQRVGRDYLDGYRLRH
ncbi:hypothetical protein GCM10010971_04160 [Silvimonas amylolytica]|uniref:Uncharacterized protein n=1 Tax=Silvimonas amylolytica TaxID=449663 RepID=A0ABQ2PG85_9NEIS|nr:hypothetical protein GCM10010971_04160 [Silvimonas amylolytica]